MSGRLDGARVRASAATFKEERPSPPLTERRGWRLAVDRVVANRRVRRIAEPKARVELKVLEGTCSSHRSIAQRHGYRWPRSLSRKHGTWTRCRARPRGRAPPLLPAEKPNRDRREPRHSRPPTCLKSVVCRPCAALDQPRSGGRFHARTEPAHQFANLSTVIEVAPTERERGLLFLAAFVHHAPSNLSRVAFREPRPIRLRLAPNGQAQRFAPGRSPSAAQQPAACRR